MHDNSDDSKKAAGAHEPNVHAPYIFRFENAQGKWAFFFIHDQNTAETNQPQAQPNHGWRAIDMAIPQGLTRPWQKFGSARQTREIGKLRV